MSLITGLLAFLALPAGRAHTSSVEAKISAAEHDAAALAKTVCELKLELGEAQAAVAQARHAVAVARDEAIDLRRANAELTSQRDYAFEQTRIARRDAIRLDERLRAQTDFLFGRQAEPPPIVAPAAAADLFIAPNGEAMIAADRLRTAMGAFCTCVPGRADLLTRPYRR
jgi:hypothetical protein